MTLAIVQARMRSKRMPGKVLSKISGVPMLVHLLNRLSLSQAVDYIVVATGPGDGNQPIREVCQDIGIDCPHIKRSENDVLGRYVDVARLYKADVVVRITGDCPLIDYETVDKVVNSLEYDDFSSNVLERTYPQGLDAEALPVDTLFRLDRLCRDEDREHVTLYIYKHQDLFKLVSLQDTEDNSDINFCVDYPEDFSTVSEIYKWMDGEYKNYEEIMEYMRWRGIQI